MFFFLIWPWNMIVYITGKKKKVLVISYIIVFVYLFISLYIWYKQLHQYTYYSVFVSSLCSLLAYFFHADMVWFTPNYILYFYRLGRGEWSHAYWAKESLFAVYLQIFSINVLALGHDIRPCYKYYEMATIKYNIVTFEVTNSYQRARNKMYSCSNITRCTYSTFTISSQSLEIRA